MEAKILNEEELQKFTKETGIRAKYIIIYKEKKNYYIAVSNDIVNIRITEDLARKFM